jgi:D-lactate dehydrogenase (cytochrome)
VTKLLALCDRVGIMVSAKLRAAGLNDEKLSTGVSILEERSFDWGTDPEQGTVPDVVVWPESTADVVTIMETASEHGIPVTPYAAGTSLEGNPVPAEGGICLDVSRMDSIVDVRPDDFQIDVQPGVFGSAVDEAVNDHGLFFPPLPSSGKISTIGGMVANDASGMQTVKYGEIHDWVLRIKAVLADGTVVETGSRAAKTSSGYNLMDLLVGSEGTLGVMTEITLELAGIPKQIHGGRVIFQDRTAASAAVSDVIQSGVDVAKIELIDALSAEITNAYLDADFPDAPMMFVEFHAEHNIESEIEFFRSIVSEHGAVEIEISESEEGMAELWEIREEMAEALEPYDPDLTPLTPGDVTVPMSQFADLMAHIGTLEDEHDLLIPCFGHAGDGNIHYTVMVDSDDPEAYERGKAVYNEIVRYAIEQGGTATGEHGIGVGKRELLSEEHTEGTVDLMQRVKHAFDPDDILNPGKMFPEES